MRHKFKDKLTLIFSIDRGEDHEIPVEIHYGYNPGSDATWVKSIGTWDPPDPAEIEILEISIILDGVIITSPAWMFDKLYDDIELKSALEERAIDEINRGRDD